MSWTNGLLALGVVSCVAYGAQVHDAVDKEHPKYKCFTSSRSQLESVEQMIGTAKRHLRPPEWPEASDTSINWSRDYLKNRMDEQSLESWYTRDACMPYPEGGDDTASNILHNTRLEMFQDSFRRARASLEDDVTRADFIETLGYLKEGKIALARVAQEYDGVYHKRGRSTLALAAILPIMGTGLYYENKSKWNTRKPAAKKPKPIDPFIDVEGYK